MSVNNYLKSFPITGYVKLAFAILFIVMGIVEQQTYAIILGGILFVFTLVNKGGCPGNSCSVPRRNRIH